MGGDLGNPTKRMVKGHRECKEHHEHTAVTRATGAQPHGELWEGVQNVAQNYPTHGGRTLECV